jgi:hypothetical protein
VRRCVQGQVVSGRAYAQGRALLEQGIDGVGAAGQFQEAGRAEAVVVPGVPLVAQDAAAANADRPAADGYRRAARQNRKPA